MDRERIIETLLLWNFWEKDINTGIPRQSYLERIKKYLTTDEIIAVTGIRRSGKSTILMQALVELFKKGIPRKNTLYVNIEDHNFYNFLNIDLLNAIWQAYLDYIKPSGVVYIVLDEIQKIQGWEHWVRALYDRKEKVKILVTGSNARLLSGEFASVLTGRHFEIFVNPLSFKEFIGFKGVQIKPDKLWQVAQKDVLKNFSLEYLKTGGFPKAVLTSDELVRKELLIQYFNDILTKDVVERFKIKDAGKLKNLAIFYSTNFTRSLSFNKVKKIADFALSLDSIHRFSHYMEEAFLIYFLPRFSYSLKNQMQAQRKVYFADNGMHNSIAFKFSEDKGKLLENAVFQQLKNQNRDIYFYSGKQEVDFVVKDGLKISELLNACYSLDSKETFLRETSALVEGMKYFNLKQAKLVVMEGEAQEIAEAGSKIYVIPFYKWVMEHETV